MKLKNKAVYLSLILIPILFGCRGEQNKEVPTWERRRQKIAKSLLELRNKKDSTEEQYQSSLALLNSMPCENIDRSLGPERNMYLESIFSKKKNARVEVSDSFQYKAWTVLHLSIDKDEDYFFFFTGDPVLSEPVGSLGGSFTIFEAGDMQHEIQRSIPNIPEELAACVAGTYIFGFPLQTSDENPSDSSPSKECKALHDEQVAIKDKKVLTIKDVERGFSIVSQMSERNCLDYFQVSETELFADIVINANNEEAALFYLDYVKLQNDRGSAEEELSCSLERVAARYPERVFMEFSKRHSKQDWDLIDQFAFGFGNNYHEEHQKLGLSIGKMFFLKYPETPKSTAVFKKIRQAIGKKLEEPGYQ